MAAPFWARVRLCSPPSWKDGLFGILRITMHTHLEALIAETIARVSESATGAKIPSEAVEVRATERADHGDYASNTALVHAKAAGKNPRELAAALTEAIQGADTDRVFERIDVAGPGFLNLFLKPETIQSALHVLLTQDEAYGRSSFGAGKVIQLEFVSSNPTGPLTVGHGRQAVLGDVLANLHERLGYAVEREYYFNDEGRQVDLLAESLWVRYRELMGERREIPENGYQGEYLIDIAKAVRGDVGDAFETFDDDARVAFRKHAVDRMTTQIQGDLAKLGVHFDAWFSETTLHRAGAVDAALEELRARGAIFEEDGALWLRAEEHGGAKDSVLIRSDGRPTYLMVDIAYHIDKHARGYDHVIDVQGADHHAEQSCMKVAMELLGYEPGWLQYAVHQFVSLKEGGETLKMSTRAGRFVTLHDLIEDLGGDERGADIVRWFMVSRKPEAHLDFDLDLARSESQDNPATYVQYAHTRIASIFRKADVEPSSFAGADLSPLTEPEELDLIKALDRFPAVIATAGTEFAPHLVADYALQLSRSFHSYYDKHRVLGDNENLTRARLALLAGLKIVLRESLRILGMSTPEEM